MCQSHAGQLSQHLLMRARRWYPFYATRALRRATGKAWTVRQVIFVATAGIVGVTALDWDGVLLTPTISKRADVSVAKQLRALTLATARARLQAPRAKRPIVPPRYRDDERTATSIPPVPLDGDMAQKPPSPLASLQFAYHQQRVESPMPGAPVFIRIFKQESQLELWMKAGESYVRMQTYGICRWSGHLGPKMRSGDQQAPEGIYFVASEQLNPTSRRHRAFNLGYPNLLDRELGRTGNLLEVHGGCSSKGCFAMTDPVIESIWRVVTAALSNGQEGFQVQVFPFRMTAANIELHANDPSALFWQDLKKGYDMFEATYIPPKVTVCRGKYQFDRGNPLRTEPIAACSPSHLARK
jgi:murein L,D-transpeptidase YafK